MRVTEIFDSIDGEGIWAGCLATFIRLSGCNLRCEYCDTSYSWETGQEMTVEEIIEKVKKYGNHHVTLTGGEPLIHKDVKTLIQMLSQNRFLINVETNGAVDIGPFRNIRNCHFTMDYKLSSAGEAANKAMDLSFWDQLDACDCVKLVCQESDFPEIKEVLHHFTRAEIYLSPIYGKVDLKKLVELLKEIRDQGYPCYPRTRMQIQLHKVIWDPDTKGV